MAGSKPAFGEVLKKDNWQLLLNQALLFAAERVNRFRWRGSNRGVLPDGYDAESIAADAVAELVQIVGARNGSQPVSFSASQLLPLARRLVWKRVDKLHRRKENFLVRNEADLAPVQIDDGEPTRLIESLPDHADDPLAALLRNESRSEFEILRSRFDTFLGPDRRLRSLLACHLKGIRQPRFLAPELGLTVATTKNLQKRLRRRFRQFLDQFSLAG